MTGPVALGLVIEGITLEALARKLRAPGRSRPCILQARILLALIEAGAAAGTIRAPSKSALARQFGVSRQAVGEAYRRLIERGAIHAEDRTEIRGVRTIAWVERTVMRRVTDIRVTLDGE